VPGVSLADKTVTLKGFNGLQGGVTVKTFDLPGDAPEGGIQLILEAEINNVSSLLFYWLKLTYFTYFSRLKLESSFLQLLLTHFQVTRKLPRCKGKVLLPSIRVQHRRSH
jgi:hypothetical protein